MLWRPVFCPNTREKNEFFNRYISIREPTMIRVLSVYKNTTLKLSWQNKILGKVKLRPRPFANHVAKIASVMLS